MRFTSSFLAAAAIAAAMLSNPAPLAAQADGTPVRVQTEAKPGKWITGVAVESTADSIGIARTLGPVRKRSTDTVYYARAELRRMEVSQGRKSNAGRGALIGGGIVGALGLASGIAFCNDPFWECDGWEVPAAAAVGFAMGALPGALIGALSHRERWVRANEAPPFSVVPSVMPGGYRKPSVTLAIQYRVPPLRR